jgi:hypothetical protein
MATGAQLPLDPNILEGIADFNAQRDKLIRAATIALLLEDLKKEIEQALKAAGEI